MSPCLTVESPQQNVFVHHIKNGHTTFIAQGPDTMA